MSRLGWWMLLGFLVVIGLFVLVVRRGGGDEAPPAPPPIRTGALALPVQGVTPAELQDTWGHARPEGQREHHAIDILAPRGTPVLAAAAGRVEKIFESKDGGHTIYVRRADPAWIDYYAHLDAYAPDVREGATVRQGQQIATVGSTGNASASAPHLHYEIKRMGPGEKWWEGSDVNPYPLLAGKPPPS